MTSKNAKSKFTGKDAVDAAKGDAFKDLHELASKTLDSKWVENAEKLINKFVDLKIAKTDTPHSILQAAVTSCNELKAMTGYPAAQSSGQVKTVSFWDITRAGARALSFGLDQSIPTEPDSFLTLSEDLKDLCTTVFTPLAMARDTSTMPQTGDDIPKRPPKGYTQNAKAGKLLSHCAQLAKKTPRNSRRRVVLLALAENSWKRSVGENALPQSVASLDGRLLLQRLHAEDSDFLSGTYDGDLVTPGSKAFTSAKAQLDHLVKMIDDPKMTDKHPETAESIARLTPERRSAVRVYYTDLLVEINKQAAAAAASVGVDKNKQKQEEEKKKKKTKKTHEREKEEPQKQKGSYQFSDVAQASSVFGSSSSSPERKGMTAGGPHSNIYESLRAAEAQEEEDAELWNKKRRDTVPRASKVEQLFKIAHTARNLLRNRPKKTTTTTTTSPLEKKTTLDAWLERTTADRLAGPLANSQRPKLSVSTAHDRICELLVSGRACQQRVLMPVSLEVHAIQAYNAYCQRRIELQGEDEDDDEDEDEDEGEEKDGKSAEETKKKKKEAMPYPWSLDVLKQARDYVSAMRLMISENVLENGRGPRAASATGAQGWFSVHDMSADDLEKITRLLLMLDRYLGIMIRDYIMKCRVPTSESYYEEMPELSVFLALSPLMHHERGARHGLAVFGSRFGPKLQSAQQTSFAIDAVCNRVQRFQNRVAIRAARDYAVCQYAAALAWKLKGNHSSVLAQINAVERMLLVTPTWIGMTGIVPMDLRPASEGATLESIALVSPQSIYTAAMHSLSDAAIANVCFNTLLTRFAALYSRSRLVEVLGTLTGLPVEPDQKLDARGRAAAFDKAMKSNVDDVEPHAALAPYNVVQFNLELNEAAAVAVRRVNNLVNRDGDHERDGPNVRWIAGRAVILHRDSFDSPKLANNKWVGSYIDRKRGRRGVLSGRKRIAGGVPAAMFESHWNNMLEIGRVVTRANYYSCNFIEASVQDWIKNEFVAHLNCLSKNLVRTMEGSPFVRDFKHTDRTYRDSLDAAIGSMVEQDRDLPLAAKEARAEAAASIMIAVSRGQSKYFNKYMSIIRPHYNDYTAVCAILRGCTVETALAYWRDAPNSLPPWCPQLENHEFEKLYTHACAQARVFNQLRAAK